MKKRLLACVFLGAVSLFSGRASAEPFLVNGVTYDIVTETGSFTSLSSTIEATPWWVDGDATDAEAFATAVGDYFGYPNTGGGGSTRAPLFAYGFQSTFVNTLFQYDYNNTSGLGSVVYAPSTVATYAVINTATVPEPASLAMISLGLVGVYLTRRRWEAHHRSSLSA